MSDFITMSCPSCGGKLSILPNALTLVCQHCGSEHIIRKEAGTVLLESFARCPQCSRNDKVQKVSAILASQTSTVQGIAYFHIESSTLASRLSPPPEPANNLPAQPVLAHKEVDITYNVVASSIIGLFGLGVLMVMTWGGEFNCFMGIMGISLVAIAAYTARNTILEPLLKKQKTEEYNQAMSNWKKLVQNREAAIRVWSTDVQIWNKLYYCSRDDCIFILGESKFAPSSHMMEYIQWLRSREKAK